MYPSPGDDGQREIIPPPFLCIVVQSPSIPLALVLQFGRILCTHLVNRWSKEKCDLEATDGVDSTRIGAQVSAVNPPVVVRVAKRSDLVICGIACFL